jgi:hypothetical protein
MKAERRHELKENTLVKRLEEIPSFSKTYGTRLLLGVIVLALLVVLIRYRMNSAAESSSQAQQGLLQAREDLKQLKDLTYAPVAQALAIATRRQDLYDDGIQQADAALKKAGDKETEVRAQALVYQGDLNWELANMPDLPGAATQPSLRPNTATADLLTSAENAYNAVLLQYPTAKMQVVAARFGLGAIAENRGGATRGGDHTQWEKARAQYQAILDSDAPQAFKDAAQARIDSLNQLEQAPLVGIASLATTLPSIEGPATRMTVPPLFVPPITVPTTLPTSLPSK